MLLVKHGWYPKLPRVKSLGYQMNNPMLARTYKSAKPSVIDYMSKSYKNQSHKDYDNASQIIKGRLFSTPARLPLLIQNHPGPFGTGEKVEWPQSLNNSLANNETTTMPPGAVPGTTTTTLGLSEVKAGTTDIHNDGMVVEASFTSAKTIAKEFLSSTDNNVNQSIESFLEKPIIISSGLFQATDTATTFTNYAMPSTLLFNDMIYSKLKGNLLFRADMEFTLQVNANPFQQGRYMLVWCPLGGASSSRTESALWNNAHTFSPTQRSQLPHVEIDIACDTAAVFTIPFSSAHNAYYIHSSITQFDAGFLRIIPFVELTTGAGGSSTASWTLWGRLINVEKAIAVIPQSGRMFDKKGSASSQEQKRSGVGPVEYFSRSASKAASYMKSIPLIGPYASTVGWAADIMSNVSSVFGWSKPLNLAPVHMMAHDAMFNWAHYDAVDNSKSLGLSCKNEIENIEGFAGTSIDEMDFDFFLGQKSYYTSFDWNTGFTVGAQLYATAVGPTTFKKLTTDNNGTIVECHCPLSLLATMFARWRGDIILTFKIVKTKFHSGRLSVGFTPYYYALGGPAVTLANMHYVNREIVDIRECNEFSITIPYMSIDPYLDCFGSNASSGFFAIHVLDPLTCPASVNSTVTVLMEVSAGKGFEFAVPTPFPLAPIYNTGVAAITHSGEMFDTACELTATTIGCSTITGQDLAPARACIGERLTSLRQLLKIPNLLIRNPAAPVTNTYINIAPYAVTVAKSNVGATTFPNYGGDLYSLLSSIYTFSRGGVRYKLLTGYVSAINEAPCMAWLQAGNYSTASRDFITSSATQDVLGNSVSYNYAISSGPLVISNLASRLGVEIQVPGYSRLISRPNTDCVTCSGAYQYPSSQGAPSTFLTVYSKLNLVENIARAGADDCTFGGFCSIPPLVSYVQS